MTTNTRFWTKTLSNPFAPDAQGGISTGGLILLGVMAGLLHVHLRYPLNISGHHGLEWMALLLFGRLLSTHRNAALTIAGGAAASYLAQSALLPLAHEVKPAFIFLLTGASADFLYRLTRDRLPLVVSAGLIGGLAFITKPMVMYALYLGASMHVGMFIKHPDYLPFLSHLLFGAAGGVGGALLACAAIPKKRS